MIGTVQSAALGRARNGTDLVLMLQVKFTDARDVRTVQFMPQAGEDTVPVKGSKVAVVDIGGIPLALASYDTILSAAAPGEKEIYSSASGTKKARIKLKKNGKIFMANAVITLLGIILGLIDLIKGLQTAGSPGNHVVTKPYQDTLESYKDQVRSLFDSEE